jgi:hypothetical protein
MPIPALVIIPCRQNCLTAAAQQIPIVSTVRFPDHPMSSIPPILLKTLHHKDLVTCDNCLAFLYDLLGVF